MLRVSGVAHGRLGRRTVEPDVVVLRLEDEEEQRWNQLVHDVHQLRRLEPDAPVIGPPRYETAAITSILHPKRLSQALARSASPAAPFDDKYAPSPPPPEPDAYADDSGSLEYAAGTADGSDRFPPDWYVLYEDWSLV